jgi:hypothetical protein
MYVVKLLALAIFVIGTAALVKNAPLNLDKQSLPILYYFLIQSK